MSDLMRITGWQIDGFGPFRGYGQEGVGPGLVVMHGPNEAGKSSLLRFLLWALFPKRGDGREAGRAAAGQVRLSLGGASYVVRREGGGVPTLYGPDGEVVFGGLAARLGGLERDTYEAIYAFSAAELLSLDSLGKDDARERLFAGATAGAGRSVREATTQLQGVMQGFWKPRAGSKLGDVLREHEAARARLREARAAAVAFPTLQARIDAALARAEGASAQARQERREAAALGQLTEAWPHFDNQQRARLERDALRAQGTLDEEAAGRLRAAQGRVIEHGREAAQHRSLQRRRAEDGEAVVVDEALVRRGPGLRELEKEAAEVHRVDEAVRARQGREVELRAALARHLAEAGLSAADAVALNLSASVEAALREGVAGVSAASAAGEQVARLRREHEAAAAAVGQAQLLAEAVQVDALAVELGLRVDRAVAEAPAAERAVAQLRGLERELARLEREAEQARSRVVPAPTGWPEDRASVAVAAVAADRWLGAARDMEAARSVWAAEVARCERSVAQASEQRRQAGEAPGGALADEVEALRRDEAAAISARSQAAEQVAVARSAEERAAALRLALPVGWRALGALPDEAVEQGVKLAQVADAAVKAASSLSVGNAVGQARTEAVVRAELAQVLLARQAAAARDAARAGAPGWVPVAVLVAGACAVLLGLALLLSGGTRIGALVLLLGLALLAVGAVGWSHRAAPVDLGPLRELGLEDDAPVERIAQRQQDLIEERVEASTAARLAGTAAHAAQTQRLRDGAVSAWSAYCVKLGLAAGTPPEGAERALRDLQSAYAELSRAKRAGEQGARARAELKAWEARVEAMAAREGVAASLSALQRRVAELDERRRRVDAAVSAVLAAEVALAEAGQREPSTPGGLREAEAAWREVAVTVGAPAGLGAAEAVTWVARSRDAVEATLAVRGQRAQRDDVARRVAEADPSELLTALGVGTLAEAAGRVARARAAEQEAREAAARLRASEQSQGALAAAVTAAELALSGAEQRALAWPEALALAGLPSTTPARALDTTLRSARSAREAADALPVLRQEREALEARLLGWSARVDAALAELGQRAGTLEERVRALRSAVVSVSEAEAAGRERARLLGEAVEAGERAEQAEAAAGAAEVELAAALAAHGLSGPEEIEVAWQRAQRLRELEVRLEGLYSSLRAALGARADEAEVRARLAEGDTVGWEVDAAAHQTAAEASEQAAAKANAEAGAAQSEWDRAAEAYDVAAAEGEVASLLADRDRLAAQYAVAALADRLLSEALATFKERHAPGVFRVASEHLRAATAGAWSGVRLSDDEKEVRVLDASGRQASSGTLSRGTTDLLYLSLRLGLARDQRPGGLMLPLVLDDVLVNLDPERADGLARILAAEAEARQVVLLTCRPESVAAVQRHAPALHLLQLDRWAGAGQPPVPGGASAPRPVEADEEVERLYEAVVLAPGSGKAELVAAAGLGDAGWARAVRLLKEAGRIVQDGGKRGATYRPGSAGLR
jgi:uncharacterized protein YhaN